MVEEPRVSLFTGITRRHWTGILLIWLVIGLLFFFLYVTARRTILNEIRYHAIGVAIATAAAVDPAEIDTLRTAEDMQSDLFRRVQARLDRTTRESDDIRYVYIMRRSRAPDAQPTDFEYVVDQAPRDANGNGVIDEDEISEPTGGAYDATKFPRMVEGWQHPTADEEITSDPPYPDLISGYAPIRNENGQTVAIVGADVIAPTVRKKYLAVQAVNLIVGVITCLLVTLVVQLYYQQREALERNQRLSDELASRNEMLRAANQELSRHNDQFQEELRLAQNVQLGFLPKTFPRQDRMVFDKFYLTCDVLGGDLFDVFSVKPDHVALYVADVSGHGVSAALISGLLKMAFTSVRERSAIATGHLHADLLRPDKVLATLNEMLVKELPDYDFITVMYTVLDLTTDTLYLASAGHPPPFLIRSRSGEVTTFKMETGTALGLAPDQVYPLNTVSLKEGDKVLYYTDGLLEAMDDQGREFGEEQVIDVLRTCAAQGPSEVVAAIRQAVEKHRGASAVSDDFSLLIAELK